MKKLLALLLVLTLAFATACSAPAESTEPATDTAAADTSTAETPAETYTIKLGFVNNEEDPITQGLYKMEEIVEASTNGGIQIEVYHSNQLGDTPDMLEQVKLGANIGCITDASRFEGSVPEFAILNAPYIYATYDDGKAVINSDIAQGLYDKLQEAEGYKVLSFNWWQGSRNFITDTEVTSVADLEGLRIRSPGTPLYNSLIESLGAKPTGLPWNDIYNAMETKVIDGAEGQVPSLYAARHYEVADYMARTGHIHLFTGLVVSEDWFNSLPEDYQTALIEGSKEAGDYASELAIQASVEMEQLMIDGGMTVTDVDLDEFKAAAETIYAQFPEFTEVKQEIDEFLAAN